MAQFDFFDLLTDLRPEEVLEAYFACRKNKRRTLSALRFEMDYEYNVLKLYQDIITRQYKIRPSNTFIVKHPVRREIFAAAFRDRIVHHLVINKIMSIFEKVFIRHSYSCRIGKGTLDGIESTAQMLKVCSENYQTDAYILRLDIEGFFFHIDKKILHQKLKKLLNENYFQSNKSSILYLLEEILMNNPIKGCHFRSKKADWDELPKTKSLFFGEKNCGLPIGNLTSQIFANFYLNDLDHYVLTLDKDLFYGRYVDDLVLIHQNRQFLLEVKEKIQMYLKENLHLSLHPKKISLTHYAQGYAFTGAYIQPGRIYPSKRCMKSFYHKMNALNNLWKRKKTPDLKLVNQTLSSINSYFGLMKHFNSYRIRLKGWNMLSEKIRNVLIADRNLYKVSIRKDVKKKLYMDYLKK